MFYPLIKLDNFQGCTTIHNFPPNNWEKVKISDKYIYIIWSDGFFWNTFLFNKIIKNTFKFQKNTHTEKRTMAPKTFFC